MWFGTSAVGYESTKGAKICYYPFSVFLSRKRHEKNDTSIKELVTSAEKRGLAGVLRGVGGGAIARKQIRTTLLHGLAKGPTGPKSASGPAVGAVQVLWFPMSKVRHQGAAHPFPIRFLQSTNHKLSSLKLVAWKKFCLVVMFVATVVVGY